MSQVVWLPEALEDVIRLRSFLEDKSLEAANRAAIVIRNGAKTLANFPAIGKPMNDGTGRLKLPRSEDAGISEESIKELS